MTDNNENNNNEKRELVPFWGSGFGDLDRVFDNFKRDFEHILTPTFGTMILLIRHKMHKKDSMNTAPIWNKSVCSDCKRIRCQKGCNCDCHQLRDRWN